MKLLQKKLRLKRLPTQLKKPLKRKLTADRLLEVGAVTGSHGLKGALTIFSHARPAIGIAGYSFWWLGDSPETAVRYTVERCWQHGGNRLLAQLEGISDRSAAEVLAGSSIWIDAAEIEVDDDEYLWEELTGFSVVATDGELLGRVSALVEFGAQDNLCVETPADADVTGEWLIPFIEDVIVEIDENAKIIKIEMLEGMEACFTPSS